MDNTLANLVSSEPIKSHSEFQTKDITNPTYDKVRMISEAFDNLPSILVFIRRIHNWPIGTHCAYCFSMRSSLIGQILSWVFRQILGLGQ